MKRYVSKSLILHMIGLLISSYSVYSYNPFAIGYIGAVYASNIYRLPAVIMIAVSFLIRLDEMSAMKNICMIIGIVGVMAISEVDFRKRSSRRNENPFFSGAISGLVFIALEMTATLLSDYDMHTIIMNVAAGVLTFCISVLFAKIIEVMMLPGGEVIVKDKDEKVDIVAYKTSGRFMQFARSLEKLARSANELSMNNSLCVYEGVSMGSNDFLEDYRKTSIWKSKVAESRKVVAIQLGEMAQIVEEMASEEYIYDTLSPERDKYMRSKLKSRGIAVKRIVILRNKRGLLEISITVSGSKGRTVTLKEFMSILEDATGKQLRVVGEYRKTIGSEEYTYNFTEDTIYNAIYGSAKCVKEDERISGDNFAFMELGSGQMVMGLSDGMGSGIDAYRDSELVMELLEELLLCGFCEEVALRLINTVFLVNDDSANPTTVDMGIIDMYTGVCDFVKLGAATTFVKRGKWVESIKSTSMPLGAFEHPDMDSVTKKLYDKDMIIMVSDGVLDSIKGENKEQFLSNLIMDIDCDMPKDMADIILDRVLGDNDRKSFDDMTVLVTGVYKKSA